MAKWFKKLFKIDTERRRRVVMGTVTTESGTLILDDPCSFCSQETVTGVPAGKHKIHGEVVFDAEGRCYVASISISFHKTEFSKRKVLGKLLVDSATVVIVDEAEFNANWLSEGPERIGYTATPNDHVAVAKLISDKFGLTVKETGQFRSKFKEPITEKMEKAILTFLKTHPEYSQNSFLYFGVQSINSYDLIVAKMLKSHWGEVVYNRTTKAKIFASHTGYGDGDYPVEGLFHNDELQGVEIVFIEREPSEKD